MSVTYSGSLYFGPANDDSRYYAWTGPTTPSSNGAWSYYWQGVKLHHLCLDDPGANSARNIYPWRALTTTWGGGSSGNDCFLRFYPANYSTSADRFKVECRFSKAGVSVLNPAANLKSSAAYVERNKVYTFALVVDPGATTVTLYACEKGGSATSLASGTYNTSWATTTGKALGTCEVGRGDWSNWVQSVGYVKRAITTAEIESLAAGTDPETVVSSAGDRGQLHLFAAPDATITPTWGTGDATRNGTWTGRPTSSAIAPNASARIECAEPPPGRPYGIAPGATAAAIPLSGTYTGFTPATFQGRAIDFATGVELLTWTNLSSYSASAGSWSGTLAGVPSGEVVVQVRDGSDTSKVWQGGNPQVVGQVAVTFGQSPHVFFETLYKNSLALTGVLWQLLPTQATGDYELWRATTASTASGYAAAANRYYTASGGKPLWLCAASVVGTSTTQWADDTGSQWTGMTTRVTAAAPKGSVGFYWLNGASDTGFTAATIKGNLDTIYGHLTTYAAAQGFTARWLTVPHNRDATHPAGNDFAVRLAQYEWTTQHASYNAGVYLAWQWTDMQSDAEATGTAQAGASTTITLAATDPATGTSVYNGATVVILSGTGAGQTRTAGASNPLNTTTKVLTVTVAWTVNPDATSVYKIMGTSPHPTNVQGSQRGGTRFGQDLAFRGGYVSFKDGPRLASATYAPAGTKITVNFTHTGGAALRTKDDGTASTAVFGFEVSTDGGSNYTAYDGAITGASKADVDLGSTPTWANVRLKYLNSYPVPSANWYERLGDLLYDDNGIGDTGGFPAYFTDTVVTPTQAPSSSPSPAPFFVLFD